MILSIALIASSAFACKTQAEWDAVENENIRNRAFKSSAYTSDSRTGLCFLIFDQNYGWDHVHVPCTPKVLEEIERTR